MFQWGHGSEAVGIVTPTYCISRSPRSFNGATALRPWESPGAAAPFDRGGSMFQWGHGSEAVGIVTPTYCISRSQRSFNGATALRRWESPGAPAPFDGGGSIFQGGHGSEAVGTPSTRRRMEAARRVSMGPRL